MKPLSIVAYFDGRLGHEKQTRGILQALDELTATNVVHKKVFISPSSYLKNWAAYCFSFLLPNRAENKPQAVDLFIGTGTHTHIPMLLDKKSRSGRSGQQQVRVVTCMTPDVLLRHKFDLCCIPRHDEPAADTNVFVTLGPPTTVKYEGKQQHDRGLILVGGLDVKSHVWKSEEVIAQIQVIITKNPSMHWTVSSSPRTPEKTCQDLEKLAASMQQLTFYRSQNTPAGWVEKEYGLNGTVWVTADSISMVYEALSAGCSVGILPVEWLQQDNKFVKSLTILHKKKMIVDFNEWQSGEKMPVPPAEPFNEAVRCAREILRRWWPERLGRASHV
jgi:mitochondrial fission protein ELM1